MSNQSNQNWKIGLGVLAGAAFGYWLNSDQGRRTREQAQAGAQEYGEKAVNYVNEQASNISETANEYFEQGKAAAVNVADKVKSTLTSNVDEVADTAMNTIEEAEKEMKKGMDRARRNIKKAAKEMA